MWFQSHLTSPSLFTKQNNKNKIVWSIYFPCGNLKQLLMSKKKTQHSALVSSTQLVSCQVKFFGKGSWMIWGYVYVVSQYLRAALNSTSAIFFCLESNDRYAMKLTKVEPPLSYRFPQKFYVPHLLVPYLLSNHAKIQRLHNDWWCNFRTIASKLGNSKLFY